LGVPRELDKNFVKIFGGLVEYVENQKKENEEHHSLYMLQQSKKLLEKIS